jgi:pilus assembly protein Flp/PilA
MWEKSHFPKIIWRGGRWFGDRSRLRSMPFADRHFTNYMKHPLTLSKVQQHVETRIYQTLVLRADSPLVSSIRSWRTKVKRIFAKFLADECGATAIEYGLIAAGISIAIIVAVNGLGTNLNDKFTSINTSLK